MSQIFLCKSLVLAISQTQTHTPKHNLECMEAKAREAVTCMMGPSAISTAAQQQLAKGRQIIKCGCRRAITKHSSAPSALTPHHNLHPQHLHPPSCQAPVDISSRVTPATTTEGGALAQAARQARGVLAQVGTGIKEPKSNDDGHASVMSFLEKKSHLILPDLSNYILTHR